MDLINESMRRKSRDRKSDHFLQIFFEISFLKNDFSETPSAQSTAVVESAHRLNAMTTAVNAIGEVPAAAASLLGNSFIFKVSFHTVVARFVIFFVKSRHCWIMVTSRKTLKSKYFEQRQESYQKG